MWWLDGDETGDLMLFTQDRCGMVWPGYVPHGQGVLVSVSTNSYDGNWTDGVRSGHGTLLYRSKGTRDSYVGNWEGHYKNGHGELSFWKGDELTHCYAGNFHKNVMSGKAVITYASHATLTGEWNDHMMSGQAVLQLPNGARCSGEFHCEYLLGRGEVVYSNGDTFSGEFIRFNSDGTTCGVGVDSFPHACNKGCCSCCVSGDNLWLKRISAMEGCMTELQSGERKHGLWTGPVLSGDHSLLHSEPTSVGVQNRDNMSSAILDINKQDCVFLSSHDEIFVANGKVVPSQQANVFSVIDMCGNKLCVVHQPDYGDEDVVCTAINWMLGHAAHWRHAGTWMLYGYDAYGHALNQNELLQIGQDMIDEY
jgi:hypothetical protein